MLSQPTLFLLFALAGWLTGPSQDTVIDQPDPFALEIPSLQTGLRRAIDSPDIHVPAGLVVSRFRVWLLDPYAQRINYSGLMASLNGQSLATIKTSGSGSEGKYLDIDLTRRPDLIIKGGKHVVEVQARETIQGGSVSGVVYRTSFVLLVGPNRGGGGGREQPSISCQSILAPIDPSLPPEDRTVPRLNLEEPFQPVDGSSPGPLRVRVRGQAVDAGGDPLALFVNGVAANSPPGTQRGREQKGRQQVPSGDSSVVRSSRGDPGDSKRDHR